jgi:hypothetical protein
MSATLATVFNFVTWYSYGHAMLSWQCRTRRFKKLVKPASIAVSAAGKCSTPMKLAYMIQNK